MPPTGTPPGDNRFALLMASPEKKRKKIPLLSKDNFPPLRAIKKDNPKFLVASSLDPNKPLTKYSCFAIHKALKNISTEIDNISQLRDGNLLILVKNDNIAKKFISTKQLPGVCNVKFIFHDNLNSVKGTIYAPCLNNISEEEIVDNLKEQGVKSVYKFMKYIDGKQVPSGVLLITFDRYFLPDKIEVSWYNTKVRPYYPNPMRCKNCQQLGHTTKRCGKTPLCDTCSLPPHTPSSCTRTLCINCSNSHPSSSRVCPKFVQMKEVIVIKTDNKCSLREAIQIHKKQIPPNHNENSVSFAEKTKELLKQQPKQPQINSSSPHVANISKNKENENQHKIVNDSNTISNNKNAISVDNSPYSTNSSSTSNYPPHPSYSSSLTTQTDNSPNLTNPVHNSSTLTNSSNSTNTPQLSVEELTSHLRFIPQDNVPHTSSFLSSSPPTSNSPTDTPTNHP